jgi:hypothetical protein
MNFELNFPELDQSSGSNLGSELNSGSTNLSRNEVDDISSGISACGPMIAGNNFKAIN